MKITKIDAGRRQLCAAINMFFSGGDPVAIHTLAAAAFRVTRDLCDTDKAKYESATKMIKDNVRPEYLEIIWKKLHESANFFKHADKDPDEIHEFNSEQTQFLMFFSVMQYRALTGENVSQMIAFLVWFMLEFPQGFRLPEELRRIGQGLDHKDKSKFYQTALAVIHVTGL